MSNFIIMVFKFLIDLNLKDIIILSLVLKNKVSIL